MSALPEIILSPWKDSLGMVPAGGACGLPGNYLSTASTEVPEGRRPICPIRNTPPPSLLLVYSLVSFLFSQPERLI